MIKTILLGSKAIVALLAAFALTASLGDSNVLFSAVVAGVFWLVMVILQLTVSVLLFKEDGSMVTGEALLIFFLASLSLVPFFTLIANDLNWFVAISNPWSTAGVFAIIVWAMSLDYNG